MARASAGVETPQERAVHVTSSDARPRETSRVRVDDECERSDDDADAVVARRRRRRSRARAGRDEVAADEDVNCASAQSSPFGVVGVDDDGGDARARRDVDVRTARARRIDAAFCGHARAGSGRFAARG